MIFTLIYLQHCTVPPHSQKTLRLNCSAIDRKILSCNKRFMNGTIINFVLPERLSTFFSLDGLGGMDGWVGLHLELNLNYYFCFQFPLKNNCLFT